MSNQTASSSGRLFLGLDLSTQQLKGVIIDETLQTIAENAIAFNDRAILEHHVQPNGFTIDGDDPRCVTTTVLVFLEALGTPSLSFGSSLILLFRCVADAICRTETR
jgi:hypothetical protein